VVVGVGVDVNGDGDVNVGRRRPTSRVLVIVLVIVIVSVSVIVIVCRTAGRVGWRRPDTPTARSSRCKGGVPPVLAAAARTLRLHAALVWAYHQAMVPCGGCRRFVHESASRCPFCDHTIVNHRSPLGGFLGVIVGVALTGCGADDEGTDSTSMGGTATMTTSAGTEDTSSSASATTMTTEDSATMTTTTSMESTGPLYGPVTDTSSSDATDSDGTSGTDGTDGTDSSGSTDASGSGDSTAAESESVGPLYGPVTSN